MTSGADLLRMLEPAVRPVGAPAPSTRPAAPLEEQSFESLLAEVRQLGTSDGSAQQGVDAAADGAALQDEAARPKANLLGPLSATDAIDNASLRSLVARGAGGST